MSGGPPPAVVLRERRPADVPALVELLAEQQAVSSYPVRWPPPFALEDFLVRPGEQRAWVAEGPAGLLGHVAAGDPGDLSPVLTAATGTPGLGMVSVLFTALAARGQGVGGLLLDTAVAWIRGRGQVPVLDVLPVHAAALRLYAGRGWVEVGRTRFAWLTSDQPDVRLLALPPYPSRSSTAP